MWHSLWFLPFSVLVSALQLANSSAVFTPGYKWTSAIAAAQEGMTSADQIAGDVWLLTLRGDRLPAVFVTPLPMAMALQIVNRLCWWMFIKECFTFTLYAPNLSFITQCFSTGACNCEINDNTWQKSQKTQQQIRKLVRAKLKTWQQKQKHKFKNSTHTPQKIQSDSHTHKSKQKNKKKNKQLLNKQFMHISLFTNLITLQTEMILTKQTFLNIARGTKTEGSIGTVCKVYMHKNKYI